MVTNKMVKEYIMLINLFLLNFYCDSEKVIYIKTEHPCVTYYNPRYFSYVNLTTRRYGRKNPVYYVGYHFSNIVPFDNNINVDFYLFEWLTNEYKRSFVEFHYQYCDFFVKDKFFGAALRQGKLLNPCPHQPDDYHAENMTINPAVIPPGFPFTRGRIYCNLTHAKTNERVGDGYIDMRIQELDKNKAKNLFKTEIN